LGGFGLKKLNGAIRITSMGRRRRFRVRR